MKKFLIILAILSIAIIIVAIKSQNAIIFLIASTIVLIWVLLFKWWRKRDQRFFYKIANNLNFKPKYLNKNIATYQLQNHKYNIVYHKQKLVLLCETKLKANNEQQNFINTANEIKTLENILLHNYTNVSTTSEMANNGKRAAFAINIPINDNNLNGLDDILNQFSQIIEAYTEADD